MSTQPGKPNKDQEDLNQSFEALGKDFEALGSVIEEEVKKAVGSIAEVTQEVVNSVAGGMRDGFAGFQPSWQQFTAQTKEQKRAMKMQMEKAAKKAKRSPQAFAKRANSEAGGAGGMTLVAGIMIAVTVMLGREAILDPDAWMGMLVTGVIALWFAWQSMTMWFKSRHLRRLSGYMSVLGERTYVTVQQIASSIGKSEMFVRNDLRKTLAHGLLEGAFLSPDGTRLFVSETAYRLYLNQQEELQRQRAQAAAAPQPKSEPEKQAQPVPEGILAECDSFVAELKVRNDRIENVAVSAQIDCIMQHTQRIRNWVTKHPHQENRVRRFTSYYLPTIMKLLDTYCDLEQHAVPGSVAAQSQKDITELLTTINTAFQTLENGLVQDTAMDVSAEISALQTVMAQDGLTQEEDFAQTSPQL